MEFSFGPWVRRRLAAAARVHARPPQRPCAAPSRSPYGPETPGRLRFDEHFSDLRWQELLSAAWRGCCRGHRVFQMALERVIADAENPRGLAAAAAAALDHQPRVAGGPGPHRVAALERRQRDRREIA